MKFNLLLYNINILLYLATSIEYREHILIF